MKAVAVGRPLHEDQEEFIEGYNAVQRVEAFHALAHDEALVDVMRQVVGDTAFPHPLKIARITFPTHHEVSTPPHQDFPNNQGTKSLTAAWVPLGDCPMELGPIAILRGSHRFGPLPLDWHPGAGNRQAVLPIELLEQCRWVTTDFEAGDVLIFPSLTVHASLHNASDFYLRLSVDFRYQREGDALTPICLQPHFQRQTWEEVYAGWEHDDLKYYWERLQFEVEDFADFPLATAGVEGFDPDADVPLENAIIDGVRDGSLQFTPEQWKEILALEAKREARHERRMERLHDELGIEPRS
jgi:hypothetical protein